jgi:uncharacterized heparinase superfamily protein
MLLAVNQPAPAQDTDRRRIFAAPYRELTGEALLRHFQTRTAIQYFPVPDAVETARPKIDGMLQNRFEFNGECHRLSSPTLWLDNPSQDREWLILLHKFYYSVGLGMAYHETNESDYAEKWVELTKSWLETVPNDFLPSDVAGRRIQNWIFAHHYFVSTRQPSCVTPDFYLAFLESLHNQISYLRDHLTPTRNHRTLELCAIFLASVVFPEFVDAAEWLTSSRDELVKNIQSDLLPDGIHCEQSTDYHHLVLKNYLWIRRLALLNRIEMPGEFDALVKKALEFSLYSHRPDGTIPSLSDGDSRCFLDLLQQGYELYGGKDLLYVASRGMKGQPPTERSKGFDTGGYYILRSGWGDRDESYEDERHLIFDCGPLGAGNHGHLDLLSFEASAYGKPLIVDPGRYTYDESGPVNWRAMFRGTAYHNTVLVDKRNQTSYQWRKGRFRISGPEPERKLAAFASQPGLDYLHGIARSHEYPVIHERKIVFVNGEYWVIVDLLKAQEPHEYDLLFHLSPQAQGRIWVGTSHDTLSIHSPQLILAQPFVPNLQPSIEEGFVSLSYGEKHRAPIVRLNQRDSCACFLTVVYPYKDNTPTISIDMPESHEGLQGFLSAEPAMARIAIVRDGRRFHDELLFTGQAVPDGGGPETLAAGHLRVSRRDQDSRLLFQYQA